MIQLLVISALREAAESEPRASGWTCIRLLHCSTRFGDHRQPYMHDVWIASSSKQTTAQLKDGLSRPPLTAAEIIQHPEFQHVSWNLTPDERGTVLVARGRGGPFKIAYEVHGHGPIHLVVSHMQ